MTKDKTQWKEFLETVSVLQWVLTFLFLGKIPPHSPFIISLSPHPYNTVCIHAFTNETVSCYPTPGVACIILMVYLMFTSLWPLPVLCFIWQVMDWQTPEKGKGVQNNIGLYSKLV